MQRATPSPRRKALALLAVGVVLLAVGQAATLWHARPFTDYWYSIAWTGFIVTADAVVCLRTGHSLALDRPRELVTMALASAGLWWSFELANVVLLDSWTYTPSPDVPRWVQRVRSTYAFATLLPATWEATLVVLAFMPPRKPNRTAPRRRTIAFIAIAGGALGGALIVPLRTLSLPLGLVSLGLIVDACNLLRGRPSVLDDVGAGRWRLPIAICVGNVAAGFVGEMWNYPADPKWTYRVPYADVWRVFEMPLPGYLGYAALALDLFALHHLVRPRRDVTRAALPQEHPLRWTGLA